MTSARVHGAGPSLAALTVGAVLLFATPHAQSSPPNVLLITIDTVRADRIGAYGYARAATPTLDRLAREGVRFADATSQAPLTGPAHAAILTGDYPGRLGIRDNATTPIPSGTPTLATRFRAHGYRTGGFIGAFILGSEYGFGQGFDTFDAVFPQFTAGTRLQVQRPGGEVVDAAIAWLRGGTRPFFAWVHLYDAHSPYDPPPPFRARFAASPYDGEVAYVDHCIATLIAALEQSGQLDRTIVAVLADHGEGLGDHGEAEHGVFLYESVLHVPWILRLPGRDAAGSVVKTQVRSIDVAPTLAALAGVPMSDVDGQDVGPFIRGAAPRDPAPSYAETFYPKWHYGWSELKSIRVGDWKYIDAPKPELYDMRTDGVESTNARDARAPLAAGLSSEIAKIVSRFGATATTAAPHPDADTLARLRSLGYVGMAAPSSSAARGADPKDMIAQAETLRSGISRAMDAMSDGHPDAAIPQLKHLLATNERSYELHLFLGDAYAGVRQFDSALGEYAAAALLNPQSAAPLLSAARAYLAAGDVVHARQKADEASRVETGSGDVSLVRGMIFEREQNGPSALTQYEAAVRANPSDTMARARLASLAMRMKRFDAARPQFEQLLQMGYRPSRMHFGLAQIAEAQGDLPRAIAEYQLAIKLEPTFADAKSALAKIQSSR